MREMVRKTAIGSFVPDSASNTEVSSRLMFLLPSTANTAAASVDPTMAPNRKPSSHETPRIYLAKTPTITVVKTTPRVANESEGAARVRCLT